MSQAVRRAAAGRIPYGVPLETALGESECVAFLQCPRSGERGPPGGTVSSVDRDEIRADLSQRLDICSEASCWSSSGAISASLARSRARSRPFSSRGVLAGLEERKSLAQRAKQIEGPGDRLTVAAREIFTRVRNADDLLSVIDQVENATDSLDEGGVSDRVPRPTAPASDALGAALGELAVSRFIVRRSSCAS